jgi:hypothetical protein
MVGWEDETRTALLEMIAALLLLVVRMVVAFVLEILVEFEIKNV